ncbi:uncharacterized protein [Periplaneta americana]|uniref:uncharacterized protein n=1 Tax=Periplaneta americana TaxID=6978 RepID=UPI0037E9536A
MESKKRKTEQRWTVCVVLGACVYVLLSACVVNATDQSGDTLPSENDVTPENLMDYEIDNIADPRGNSFGGYIVGRVVDSLVTISTKHWLPYTNKTDSGRMFSFLDKNNRTFKMYGDNPMWDGLFKECGVRTTLTCVKKNVFEYLDRSIATDGDFEVTDSLVFTKNENTFENKYDRHLNNASHHHNSTNSTEELSKSEEGQRVVNNEDSEQRSFDSFYSLTNVLYDKGVKFVMTHDLELQLPEMLFDGAVVRISPKALEEDGGALLKLEVNRKKDDSGEGRIFFKKHKKKLMMAFFALMMVIKMIKVKLMFLLPMLLGVGTAKKIFLKLLLFVFPAFAHIFKFCAYYHAAHTKYHHHHHQIAHHHHHVPVHVPVPVHVDHSHTVHIDHPHPPSTPPEHYGSSGPSGHGIGWETSAPDFISNRNEYLTPAQENELESWGLMSKGAFHVPAAAMYPNSHSLAYNSYNQMLEDPRVSRSALPVTEATGIFYPPPPPSQQQSPARYQTNSAFQQPSPIYVNNQQQNLEIQRKQQQLLLLHQQKQQQQQQQNVQFAVPNAIQQQKVIQVAGPSLGPPNKQSTQNIVHEKLNQQQLLQQKQQQLLLEQQKRQQLIRQQQQQPLKLKPLTPKPPTEGTTIPVTYDPFYSPILQKMDNVFVQLGFNEEACRERLVCSMYKTPARFSPHSNLISAELSRDSRELQKPAVPNSASVRFHRYVQAARDGQDHKDCLRLYPACTVKTE